MIGGCTPASVLTSSDTERARPRPQKLRCPTLAKQQWGVERSRMRHHCQRRHRKGGIKRSQWELQEAVHRRRSDSLFRV
ncbi:hypothetical protein NDU88_002148 [Pleurodeles waltl]|uniref:Uncharacterized protein n=1 Tax=Pleurodeles waltl TaxID=8319 RepID=A0AAV7TKB8_PLEWA|nr:hypothetical protein NDU88_002148 [Pleurodeles waltl]